MKIYIRSAACISPQNTFNAATLLAEPVSYSSNRLKAIEPDYKPYVDAKLIRRMSRIIRMGVASAMHCLQDAELTMPDAIITGTAYGCLEDTGIFLSRIVEQQEEMLSPTAFIQSTHNTIGAQIALMLQCRNYNNTFTQRGHSFEYALLDAMLLLKEQEATHILTGSVDELTDISFDILNRFGLYRRGITDSLKLFETAGKGTIAGEGASFFVISSEAAEINLAQIEALDTFYSQADVALTAERIQSFLSQHELQVSDIDLLLLGKNGDAAIDSFYNGLQKQLFSNTATANYKHLCGEYPTSISFALWMAANIINTGSVPELMLEQSYEAKPVKRILLYNYEQPQYHTLILVSAC